MLCVVSRDIRNENTVLLGDEVDCKEGVQDFKTTWPSNYILSYLYLVWPSIFFLELRFV